MGNDWTGWIQGLEPVSNWIIKLVIRAVRNPVLVLDVWRRQNGRTGTTDGAKPDILNDLGRYKRDLAALQRDFDVVLLQLRSPVGQPDLVGVSLINQLFRSMMSIGHDKVESGPQSRVVESCRQVLVIVIQDIRLCGHAV